MFFKCPNLSNIIINFSNNYFIQIVNDIFNKNNDFLNLLNNKDYYINTINLISKEFLF